MKSTTIRAIASLGLAALLGACSPAASIAPTGGAASPTVPTPGASPGSTPVVTAPPSPTATPDRVTGWRSDLDRILPGIERIHPDPFHGTSREEFQAAIAALSEAVPTATDDELMVGVLRIGALLSARGHDGHSGGFVWGTGTYPVESLPFRLWLFPDELTDALTIVDALPPHEDLVGSRIDTIEGRPVLDVRKAVEPVIPRDNDQTVRLLTPRYLMIPQVLRGLGLADDGPIELGLTAPDGASTTIDVEPIPMADYNAWAGPYGLHLPADDEVLYLSRMDEDLWWERLPDGETLFVQYNAVDHLAPQVLTELDRALSADDVARVVLDVRHNTGGEVPALVPFIELLDQPEVDVRGKVFVIVGRNTWSAGSLLIARLEARTEATFVGEPSAGNPTFYGDVVPLPLPYSGLELTITEMLEVGVTPDDPRLNIDLDAEAELTFQEWLDGRDPALEAILGVAP